MSRGPTGRVRRLVESGEIGRQLLQAADHEADLLEHPYIGTEHVALARLRIAGKPAEREALLRSLTV